MKKTKFIILLTFLFSCENKNELNLDNVERKMTANYVIMSYFDIYGDYTIHDFKDFCKDKFDYKIIEIKQIDTLINKILECSGGIYTENENYSYPNPYDQECVSSLISKQKSKNFNLIDIDFLDKVSEMYLHEAISVLRIRYYYSFAVLNTFNSIPIPQTNVKD